MPEDTVKISQLGYSFSQRTIHAMFRFAASLPKNEKHYLTWLMVPDKDGNPTFDFCSYGVLPVPPDEVEEARLYEDVVGGITFYWLGFQENLDDLRENYWIDYDKGTKQFLFHSKET